MNCAQARPLLLAGDAGADAHLEGCVACGRWLEANDPVVSLVRRARPEALPAPAGLRRRVLLRWSPRSSSFSPVYLLGAATAGLLLAAVAALLVLRQDLVARMTDFATPILNLFQGPRELMLDNLPALVLTLGVAVLAVAFAGVIYRDLGHTVRRAA